MPPTKGELMLSVLLIAMMGFSAETVKSEPSQLVGAYSLKGSTVISADGAKYQKYCTNQLQVSHDVNNGFKLELVGLAKPLKAHYAEAADHSQESLDVDSSTSTFQLRVHRLHHTFEKPDEYILENWDGFLTRPELKIRCTYSKDQ